MLFDYPVYISIFGWQFHPHFVFDLLAYFIGYKIYQRIKIKQNSLLTKKQQFLILVSGIAGAFIFSKVLAWYESPYEYFIFINNDAWSIGELAKTLMQGKTVVGGIIGGWAGVEIYKKSQGILGTSGDHYVFPLIVGMSIGRIGCFLSGLEDKTYGLPTTLPWGIDFGDEFFRHPTQLYEILFLVLFAIVLLIFSKGIKKYPGLEFKIFVSCYLFFRFFVEFLKPIYAYPWGLGMIQTVSLLVAIFATYLAIRQVRKNREFNQE